MVDWAACAHLFDGDFGDERERKYKKADCDQSENAVAQIGIDGLVDQFVDEGATENSDHHVYADNGASWCDFLRKAICTSNLDRRHKEHIELDLTVN